MPDVEVDPSQVHSIEVDPSQVQAAPAEPKSFGQGLWDTTVGGLGRAIKHYGVDLPQQHADEIQQKWQAGDHLGAIAAAVKAGGLGPGTDLLKDTAKGQFDQFEKAADALTSPDGGTMGQRISTAMGHTAAGLVPVVGPAAAHVGEDLGEGMASGHPSYALGEAGGLLLPFGVSKALDAVPKSTPVGSGSGLRASAEADYARALNPTTRANKAITANQLAPGLAERGVVSGSLQRVKDMAESNASEFGQKIDDRFDQWAQQGKTLPAKPILKRLEDYAKRSQIVNPQTGVVTELDPALAETIEHLKSQVQSAADPKTGEIHMENLRQIRQYYDSKLQGVKDWALDANQHSQVEAARQLPNAIRGTFADASPELAADNAEFSFHKNLAKVAGDTLDRTQGQKPSLTVGVAKAMGAAAGSHGGPLAALGAADIAGKLAKFQQSFLWKSLSAQSKLKVAELLEKGDPQGALKAANQAALTASSSVQSPRSIPDASLAAQ